MPARGETSAALLEQSMSEALDMWREGRYEQLPHEENVWKMQLADVLALSGVAAKKSRHTARKKHNPYSR